MSGNNKLWSLQVLRPEVHNRQSNSTHTEVLKTHNLLIWCFPKFMRQISTPFDHDVNKPAKHLENIPLLRLSENGGLNKQIFYVLNRLLCPDTDAHALVCPQCKFVTRRHRDHPRRIQVNVHILHKPHFGQSRCDLLPCYPSIYALRNRKGQCNETRTRWTRRSSNYSKLF